MPETSIVIRTFNEEKYLPGLLDSIRNQKYVDYEIIVVDSGSFDRTREIAEPYASKVLRIESDDFTFGYSLNVGIQATEGRYISIVSAHTMAVDERWLGNLIMPLSDDEVAMSYGRQVGWKTSKFGDVLDLKRTFGVERRRLKPSNFFANNANSAIRKDLWRQYPFDEALTGLEDIEWARHWMEQGYRVAYEPDAAVYHIHEESWPQVRRRYYREAFAAKAMGVQRPRHLPFEIVKEGRYLLEDLYQATRQGEIGRRLPEIVLYRVNKMVGTTRGLLDGRVMSSQVGRRAIFFNRQALSVVIRAPGRASLERTEVPMLKPSEVLIRVAYAGVTPTDVEMFDGSHALYKAGDATYPIVPGQEVGGTVVATGPNVSTLAEGDPVTVAPLQVCGRCTECERGRTVGCSERLEMGVAGVNGGYAQYLTVPSRFVYRVPSEADLLLAVLSHPLATVVKGLNRLTRAWPDAPAIKRCAVVGMGPLGHLCARVLELRGHEVSVIDRNPRRLSYFAGSNIRVSENRDELDIADVLVETTGDTEVLGEMMAASMPGAVILLLGVPMAHQQFTFRDVVEYDKVIVGSVGADPADVQEALELLPLLELEPLVERVLPLDRFAEAWESLRNSEHLKTLLQVAPE